ncbi:Pituitary-specific positive transcription factor 1 like [Actinidia chinensis var. chinensis]|uniref:Pituitary-specific positive transcription factor 1 like n=1 Tax=Actinidia chinensis var. chinensis TaxID=1590841 RepID=A0A2R6QCE1_ACTCC|nr:Pituitary-specific positive transcription factor 1 like [Actinidia chinensis var. chinensis]
MKNKLFLCFRPIGIETETEPNQSVCFDDGVFTCIPVSNHRAEKISDVKSTVSTVEKSNCSKNEVHSKSFSGFVKAIMFEISLKKKARKKQVLQIGTGSNRSKSDLIPEKSPNTKSQGFKRDSIEYSSTSNSRSSPSNQKKQSILNGSKQSETGLFLILISLAITMFLGRFYAVIFTLLGLYSMSRRRSCELLPENVVSSSTETARDYRKRVIMEGLLERNHRLRGH